MRVDNVAVRSRNADAWAIRKLVVRTNGHARTAGAVERVRMADVRFVLARDGARCVFCGIATTGLDHIVPLRRGGSNASSNLQVCCVRCNQLKASRTNDEFRSGNPTATCRRGHVRTAENTYRRPNGSVECVVCFRAARKKREQAA